ncbi:MAG TPA: FAD binding domain-containing protein [Anaerolineales bacterium]|nr:FAD binding domain-containing protein [Anaerolineales bacterium]
MWKEYISASSVDEVVSILAEKGEKARIIAGGTDLMLEFEHGQRENIETLIDVSRIPGLDSIQIDSDGKVTLGALVTHNMVAADQNLRKIAFPLVRACWEVGAPQIRNRGTVAGNVVTASPANDTITPLMALDASVTLRSIHEARVVKLSEFYTGVRKTVMRPDELMVNIQFQGLKPTHRGTFIKSALRKTQAISVINVCVILEMEKDFIKKAAITLGAVAPTIIHACDAEEFLAGKKPTVEVIEKAAEMTRAAAKPISDIRGSAEYRNLMVAVHTKRALTQLANNEPDSFVPEKPVILAGADHTPQISSMIKHEHDTPIQTTINGKPVTLYADNTKTLLRVLREEGNLIGSKEGCSEGECGACTIYLDGKAVMSCLVPAARAHGAQIVTVEGIAPEGELHPVQEAFIETGAVQCGYCTPGFIMSAVKLLEEVEKPTKNQIEEAFAGNLCRCTGYYKIIEAVEKVK